MVYWVAYILPAFGLSVLMTHVLRGPVSAVGLVDHPDFRKRHDGAIPLCGGLAVFLSFLMINFVGGEIDWLSRNMWVGLAIILAIGVIDDRIGLPAIIRLVAQFIVAFIIVDLGRLNGPAFLGSSISVVLSTLALPVAYVIAILFVVGLTNSLNMLDGVDGLAGGCAAVALFWLAVLSAHFDAQVIAFHAVILCAAVCGFLVFNIRSPWRSRASVFLGDAGSTSLGVVIAALMIALSCSQSGPPLPVLLWLVIVPVVDTLSLIVRRLKKGRSPLAADRMHLHHLLLEQTGSPMKTAGIIIAITAICGAIGSAGAILDVPDAIMTFALFVPMALHSSYVIWAQEAIAASTAQPGEPIDITSGIQAAIAPLRSSAAAATGHPPWRQEAAVHELEANGSHHA